MPQSTTAPIIAIDLSACTPVGYVSGNGNLKNRFFLFGPDGRCFYGKPSWQPNGTFDLATSVGKEPATACTHRIEGEKLVVTWLRDKTVDRYSIFRTDRGDLAFRRSGGFYPMYPSRTTRLAGRFLSRTFASLGGSPSQAVGVRTTIVNTFRGGRLEFKNDGTFVYQKQLLATGSTSVGSSTGTRSVGNSTNNAESAGAGRYRILGNFLTLTFDDGSVLHDIFEPESTDADPNKRGFFWGYDFYSPR
jgi:hypothetical protein